MNSTVRRPWSHDLGVIAVIFALMASLAFLLVTVFVAQVTTDMSWADLARVAWLAVLPR